MTLHVAHILALLSLILIGLSLNVSRLRLKYKVSYGSGGHKDLLVAIRAHGNAMEQSLLFAVLLLALEAHNGSNPNLIPVLGLGFLLARGLHVLAVFRRLLMLRQIAHVATLLAQLVAVFTLLQ